MESPFRTHPRLRWAVPVLAVVVVAGGISLGTVGASADNTLGPRTPQQLLVDVQQARLTGLSGTVVQTSDLGLPDLPGLGERSSDLMSPLTGSRTWRVWYAGPDKARLALVGTLGESDVIRNGRDVWVWSSDSKSATHYTLPADRSGPASGSTPTPAPSGGVPATPQQAAEAALAALDPTTEVTSPGTTTVAGRAAHELVLRPRQGGSLVQQVRIAVDGSQHVPLRVQVFSTRRAEPAFEVGFTSVDFAVPEDRQFTFTPPPGTTVTDKGSISSADKAAPGGTAPPKASGPGGAAGADAERPRVIGTGWASVIVADTGQALEASSSGSAGGSAPGDLDQLRGVLSGLPKVSGSWGSGRLFTGTLFSAVLTDDGRLAVGAVEPQRLYDALSSR